MIRIVQFLLANDYYPFCCGHTIPNSTWVTEDDIFKLKGYGLNTLRLPVGDYMFTSYGAVF